MRRFVLVLLCLAAIPALAATPAQALKRPLDESDLLRFRWAGDPNLSPDGNTVAFVLTQVDTLENGYTTSVWSVPTEGGVPRRVTHGPRDSAPRWSPDGRRLAFLRTAEAGERPQVWILPLEGGEAEPLTSLPGGAGTPLWSPDGAHIAFTAATRGNHAPRRVYPGGWQSDTRVVTNPSFRSNGSGWKDPEIRRHLWTVSLADGVASQVTQGPWDETLVSWSPESSTLFFTSDRRTDPWLSQRDRDLYGVLRTGGEPLQLIDFDGPIGSAAVHRSGRWAMIGAFNPPVARTYQQSDLLVAGPVPRGGRVRQMDIDNVTAKYDADMGNLIGTDLASPRAGGGWNPVWSENGKRVFAVVSERGSSYLARIETESGEVTWLTPPEHSVTAMSATPNAKRFAFVMASGRHPGDIWTCDDGGRRLRRITGFNDDLLAEVQIMGPEELLYTAPDGAEIQGWMIKPHGYEPWGQYPLVVEIHGGPHVAYGHNFFHEFQVLAGRGNIVLYVNPRGSATYGEDFAQQIQYAYPGGDIPDIMAGVDQVIATGLVDTTRMGVTGGSGGGYLTNWIIVQNNRFAAAATQRCVSEWLSFWATADFTMYTPFWFRKQPWEDPMEYVQRSPVYYADRIRTPLLIIHSDNDLRTPANQAEAMFRALRGQGKTAAMVRFPGEDHNLSRKGSPFRRVERLRYLAGWFDRYLSDKPTGLFNDAAD